MRPNARRSIVLSASSYASHIESIDRLTASRDQGDVRPLAGGRHVMQPNEWLSSRAESHPSRIRARGFSFNAHHYSHSQWSDHRLVEGLSTQNIRNTDTYRLELAHSLSHPHNHRQVRGLDTPYGRENGAPLSKRVLGIHSRTTDNGDLQSSLWACPLRGMAVVNQTRLRQVLALRASILKPLAHRGPARSACFRDLRRPPGTSLRPCK